MTIQTIKLTTYEWKVLDFWKTKVNPISVEMIGFDCFMQHSCSPNGHQVYRNETEYVVYATKTIEQGGTITCDYMALDNQVVGLESRPTIEFLCLCGEKNCRGMLRC